MPLFDLEDPTTGDIITVEHPQAPTQEEAQAILASLPPTPKSQPKKRFSANTPRLSPEKNSLNQFISAQRAGPIEKLGNQLSNAFDSFVTKPIEAVGSAAEGIGRVAGEASTQEQNPLLAVLGGPLQNPIFQDLAQTGLEAGARGVFDLGNAINQLATKTANNPENILKALGAGIPLVQAMDLLPHTPTNEEINQFIADQSKARQVGAVKSQPLLPEVIGNTDVPLANALETVGTQVAPIAAPLLRGTAGAISSPIQTVKSLGRGVVETVAPQIAARTAPATVEQSAMAALDFTKDQVQQHIPVVTQRVSEIVGKVPKTTSEAIKFIDDAENQLYKDRLEVNNAAEKAGYVVSGDDAIQAAKDTLDSIPSMTDSQRAKIISDLEDAFKGDHTPDKGQAIQQRLNKEFSAQFENGTFDRAAPLNEAKLAIRNSVADQMDQIQKAVTGREETPYSDIGSLIEVKGSLKDKLNKLEGREAAQKTGIEARPSKLPISKTEAATKAGRSILSPFQKTQIERLDQNVQRIFSESPQQIRASEIPQPSLNELRSEVGATVPSNTLEDQIQALIQSYPRNIRSNPFLARTIAEAELGKPRFNEQGQTITP